MARQRVARDGGDGDDELAVRSQRLVEAALRGDVEEVEEALSLAGSVVDVNYIGTVSLRVKCTEAVIREESAGEVRIGYEEFKTDVTALFAAAHSGHADVVRKLLSAGADVNQKLFRGYAASAAACEGHCDILSMLLKAVASQPACEDALLEASLCGEVEAVKILILSDMVRPEAAAHALVSASSRGFVNVVSALVENGVDVNCMDRVLLRSVKPALHANVDSTPLVAAIVSRQIAVVRYLLEAGARTDCLVRVGAWSWDPMSGEELRVGVCLGEPYSAAWCAVEFYEATGEILKLLFHHDPSLLDSPHRGRTLLCHAILCQNHNAVDLLLETGANPRFPIRTKSGYESRPLHLAVRMGCLSIVKRLILHGCDVNVMTSNGETPLMISGKADQADCFLELLKAGADLGLVSMSGDTAIQLAKRSIFGPSITNIFSQALVSGATICSTDLKVFSPLHFAAGSGDAEVMQMMLNSSTADLDKLDGSGLTPIMVAANKGHAEAFRLLVMAGADIAVKSDDGRTLFSILECEGASMFKDCLEEILLSAVLANVLNNRMPFKALHYASRKGSLSSLLQVLRMGYPVDSLDDDGHSPLMLAAMEGHAEACKLLLSQGGANCELINDRKETALSLARRSSRSNKATEGVILDHLARSHVLAGEELCKHTREGRGSPHMKTVRMLKSGVLTWGKTSRRNVACKEAAAGPGIIFSKNRGIAGGDTRKFVFRVTTVTGREVHFEASSPSGLELWVRGVNLIVMEATSSTA